MKFEVPILSVKLKMPQPRKNYIIRKELFHRLENMKEYKVTIVKAGAGCGKTTLLSSFVKETKMENVKWITLDENADQAFVFWNYAIEVLKDYFGDTKADFQTLFDSNMQKDKLWRIISILINKLFIKEDIFLVIDDFQMISDSFLISTINYFIENMSENIHLILLTREIPDIYLGTLAIEGNVIIIEEDAIRLTQKESLKFLTETLKLDKNEEKINDMIEASEGWIGGLQLLAIASKEKNSETIKTIKLSNRLLEDYITKEIFEFLTKEEQDFLVETSILRYFSKEICNNYQPKIDFMSMIESILQKNLLVINIDDNVGVYRYHSILSEYLKGIFNKFDNDKKAYLHNLAADIYYGLGDYEETLHHLFIIKEYEKIMELILKMPQTALTFSYIMKVPMKEIIKNKDFAYQYFFYYYASFDTEVCKKIYDFINKYMKNDKTFVAFKHADMFLNYRLELDKVKILSLNQIDSLPLNPVTTAFLLIKEAYFLFASSKYKESIEYLNSANQVYKQTGNIYIGFFILSEKAQICEDIGDLDTCFSLYKEMELILPKLNLVETCYYIGIAGAYTKKLALSKTFEALEKVKELLINDSSTVDFAYQYTLAEYYYLVGNHEMTEKILTDIMNKEIFKNIYFSARLLRYPICRDNNKKLAKQFLKEYEDADDSLKIMECDLLYSIIQYENGNIEKAKKLVNEITQKARKMQNKLKIIECDLFKIRMLLDMEGNKNDIQNLFLEAVSYGAENGLALPFWFEKKTTKKVMADMGAEFKNKLSSEEIDFISSILNSDGKNGIKEIKKNQYDLTEREKEVLNELAKGSTNKQIAENLYISLSTVKSHIINIYGKLGVNNRVAAVNKIYNKR
ncbi:helix-turn-helix transcriptional regulator [Clostridium taeniosporum]|uniref:HTH luxR-type domain-containing protein n=1 Tax=Clostridium taeniosporum TaxID=394958 RepID=A0A1D7XMC2_9CLOT|nr:LuxR C-terminal-related transcriptional regulator [Clostridium taeniosporum]AOR24481.1 hypothetical protein BGI42_12370 [Clostridium taeniosporum]